MCAREHVTQPFLLIYSSFHWLSLHFNTLSGAVANTFFYAGFSFLLVFDERFCECWCVCVSMPNSLPFAQTLELPSHHQHRCIRRTLHTKPSKTFQPTIFSFDEYYMALVPFKSHLGNFCNSLPLNNIYKLATISFSVMVLILLSNSDAVNNTKWNAAMKSACIHECTQL